MACLLILAVCPLCGCSATVGRAQGDLDAAFLPGWERVRQSAVKAAQTTGTWVSAATTQEAVAGDSNAQLPGRTPVTSPLYGVQTSANSVTGIANSTHSQPDNENGTASFPQGTISVMAPPPAWEPADGKQSDTMNALAGAAVGQFVGAVITSAFPDQDRDHGFTPSIKGSKNSVLVSLKWFF